MLNIMRLFLGTIARLFCARRSLLLENLALRQQLAVFKRRHPRTRLTFLEKLFWVAARQICSDWKQFLIVVLPDTVVQWHRSGFALYWRLISRFPGRAGRKRIAKEIRDLIFRMVAENATWGAPRIHGELLMLGFDVSERNRASRIAIWDTWATNSERYGSSVRNNPMKTREKVVGAKGFEPSTSWSRITARK
jgi:hypothetical protein